MGKFDGVLLVSDYDDTLYGSGFYVSDENRSAILRFMEQGGAFTVATGRAHTTFAPQVELENLTFNAPVVLSNGCTVYDFNSDRLLVQTRLPHKAASHLTELAAAFPDIGFEAYHNEDIYVYNGNRITWAHLNLVGGTYTELPIDRMPLPWIKVILEQEYPLLLKVRDYLLRRWGDLYECTFSNRYLLELTSKGSTKGGAVRWVAGHMGIGPGHIYCIGDNQNDIPMLEVSSIPFAPSNCAQEVRDWGATLVGSCNEHCVAQVIDILDKRY